MSTFKNKMTVLADVIRSKSGETDSLTLDEMAIAVESIETGGGSGGGGGSIETCTLIFKMTSGYAVNSYAVCTYVDGVHNVSFDRSVNGLSTPITITNVVENSLFVVNFAAVIPRSRIVGNAECCVIDQYTMYFRIFASAGETVEIELYDDD